MVAWGNSFVPNEYACGAAWSTASATCWLGNCSAGPAPFIGPDACFDQDVVPACESGDAACDVNRWLATAWTHYIDSPALLYNVSSCLASGASARWPVDADALAEECIEASGATALAGVLDFPPRVSDIQQ